MRIFIHEKDSSNKKKEMSVREISEPEDSEKSNRSEGLVR